VVVFNLVRAASRSALHWPHVSATLARAHSRICLCLSQSTCPQVAAAARAAFETYGNGEAPRSHVRLAALPARLKIGKGSNHPNSPL
jgi:hypothetical protein